MARVVADAVEEGRFIACRRTGGGAGAGPAARTDEQEAEIAAQQAEARNQAARAAQEREARLAARADGPNEQSAVETAALASDESTAPGLTPENAQNLLDDASAVTQAEIAAEQPAAQPEVEPAAEPVAAAEPEAEQPAAETTETEES